MRVEMVDLGRNRGILDATGTCPSLGGCGLCRTLHAAGSCHDRCDV
jgi:hypothetical protein